MGKVKDFIHRAWDVPVYLGTGAMIGSLGQRPSYGHYEDLAIGATGLLWMLGNGGSAARVYRNFFIGVLGVSEAAALIQPSLESKIIGAGFVAFSAFGAYLTEKNHEECDRIVDMHTRFMKY